MNAQVGPAHEIWWDVFFHCYSCTQPLTVLTTNWDIWIERALRPQLRSRKRRPGFNYGRGPERLTAAPRFPERWYRGTVFGENTTVDGHATLLKLHGSLSWALKNGQLEKYGDLRPAFRGNAAIVPPIQEKEFGVWLRPIWEHAEYALARADRLIVVGYSFPDYDREIRCLLQRGFESRRVDIHVFDPSASSIAVRIQSFLPQAVVVEHGKIPDACEDLEGIANLQSS
jgi:hypothetical protein